MMVGSVSGSTYSVCASGCDYSSIQAAIDAASDGDTINVLAGTYNENVNVNKPLNLIGAGMDVTTVQAAITNDHVFEVTVDSVNISGFKAEGAAYPRAGIFLYFAAHCNLININASNNYYGIYLDDSSNYNTLTNNTASNNYYGIYLARFSNYNTLTYTNASNNYYGIYLDDSSNYNTLTNNTASNNNYGIYLARFSNYNTLTYTNAKENSYWDISLDREYGSDCNNILKYNTGSGDRPIKYYNYSVNLQDEILSELILCNADNSNIVNVTIIGSETKKNNGLMVLRTDNSNFTNINSSNNKYGIDLYYVNHYNSLTNNTANSNDNCGITLQRYSHYNTLTDNAASNNGCGIDIYYSSNNILTNNIANSNVGNGIGLTDSESNIITKNTVNSNGNYGINFIYSGNKNNTITKNTVNSNGNGGIYLYYSSNNFFYNNFFNNEINVDFPVPTTNTWNTPKTPGTNIINGPYIGGNYWGYPNGTGFSQTCSDVDLDGICDSFYNLTSGNVDYFPLTTPCTINFPDVPEGHWAHSYIEYLFCNGIVNGYPDGTFQPGNSITRGQFAKMIVNANGIPEYHPATPTFTDVPSDHWSYGYVEAAVQAGIISGYPDGTFRPANQVTRAQISTMIARSRGWTYSGGLEEFTDVPPSHWAYDNIMSMKEMGIIGGYPDGTFLPANQATRGQNSKMIANMMQTP